MDTASTLYDQAITAAAGTVLFGRCEDETLEDAAHRFIRSADPHQVRGTNSEGSEISFTWSFDYIDIPGICEKARELAVCPQDQRTE